MYFQSYHDTVKRESLYSKPEELVAWYHAAGFVSREGGGGKEGDGVLISITKMDCKDREKGLEILNSFAPWVEANEAGVLTYATFARPKAPNELVLFVIFADRKACKAYSDAPERVDVVKRLAAVQQSGGTTLWEEVQDSFVSGSSPKAAQAKL